MTLRRIAALVTLLLLALGPAGCTLVSTPTPTPIPTPTPVPFKNSAFKVNAGSTYTVPFDVAGGTRVEYSYASDLDFNFLITDPQGNVISYADRSLRNQGSFIADRLGRYTLHFDNEFSLFTGKNVSLRYRVVPPGGR